MFEPVVRLSPIDPAEPAPRPRWKPHEPAALEAVRRLVETTGLSYRAIAARTGVPRSTVSRHVLEQGWLRPTIGADTAPLSPEAERRARRGELADLILRAAEQRVTAVAMNPTAPPSAFAQAARLLAIARRLERPGQPRRRVPRRLRLKGVRREAAAPDGPVG